MQIIEDSKVAHEVLKSVREIQEDHISKCLSEAPKSLVDQAVMKVMKPKEQSKNSYKEDGYQLIQLPNEKRLKHPEGKDTIFLSIL